MPASLRELRSRRDSVANIQKITRAMELIAASRIIRAQQQARAATPYARELTRAVSALATYAHVDHPFTVEAENPTRAAVLLITSDRGQAGAYSTNVLRMGDQLTARLREEGKEVVPFITGRKGKAFYRFRQREMADSWDGFSDSPVYADARQVADVLLDAFLTPTEEGGVDEVHIVYTQFVSRITQKPEALRLLPLEVVEDDAPASAEDLLPLYEFEPDAETVLNEVLPLYVRSRIFYCLLQAAASELAARQTAMQAATDNADELIRSLTREANQARQASITQEISEIVGGASALADANSE